MDEFDNGISYVASQAATDPVVLIIDEVQFLAMQDQGFLSMLQHLIDHNLLQSKIKLVLCGSYVSFMENELLAHKSPLFGRRTAAFKIEPFGYRESFQMLGDNGSVSAFEAWGILGGMPMYLKQFDTSHTLRENIIDRILEKGTMLHDEPLFAVKQELKEPALYFSIIEAISSGRSKYNQISTFIGTDAGYYLNTLVNLGIVDKTMPVGKKGTSRKSIYRLRDPFFAFWFRYVSRGYSLVEMEKQELLYDTLIESDIGKFLGYRFEDFCIEYLMEANGSEQLPITFSEIGRWWGTDKNNRTEVEIDIVALGFNDDAIIAECKWRNELTDIQKVVKLYDKSQLIKRNKRHLVFFSKTGYTEKAIEYAKDKRILLITYKDMTTNGYAVEAKENG